ncbi:MAG: tetratricopeptide repeat protein [Roseiarcus sp.]
MAITIFLSTVTDEFRDYRDLLIHDLTRHDVAVKVQEDFNDLGGFTLDKLDTYIRHCDAVVHLVGEMCGSAPGALELEALEEKHRDRLAKFPALGPEVTYTQWEAWLALLHAKTLVIAKAKPDAVGRGPKFAPTDATRALQAAHLERLKRITRFPGCQFDSPADLAKRLAYSAILDLLVHDYAKAASQAREVAEGFIREMAGRVARAENLDLDGMKQAVRNAIAIYVDEIAGAPTDSNLEDIVARALKQAKAQFDKGQSALANATLDRAAEDLERDERERRELFAASVTQLRTRQRDFALATYNGDAAAAAILALGRALHGADAAALTNFLEAEAGALHEHGETRGSNVHLVAEIALRREALGLVADVDTRGRARGNLGLALRALGGRESGTSRLEQAVAAFRAALEEFTRERVPLDWAATQNNLGNALQTLGGRESGTARLEEAVAAYRAALEERTRERVPLHWATTQNNLGATLSELGKREIGTARLDKAVAAFRAALEEFARERVPLDWAMTQNNLGIALAALGERESGTVRLEEAVAAYRAALEEYTRELVPLDWAMTQNNLGIALQTLGERESGTARLDEAVAAYRAALEERTRDRVPLDWAMTQNNLGAALHTLGERESGTARLEEAVAAYRAALEEFTRERVPLDWAMTQNNLGNALAVLGERESGTARLEEAVDAYHAALEERSRSRAPLEWAMTQNNLGGALRVLGEREDGTARLEMAVAAFRAALEEFTRERVPLRWAMTLNNLGNVLLTLGERESGTARLEQAVEAYRVALEEFTPERTPYYYERTKRNLDGALELLRQRAEGEAPPQGSA